MNEPDATEAAIASIASERSAPRALVLTENIKPFSDLLSPMKGSKPVALAHRPDVALEIVRRAPVAVVFCSIDLAAHRLWQPVIQDVLNATRANAVIASHGEPLHMHWIWMLGRAVKTADPMGITAAPDLVAATAWLLSSRETAGKLKIEDFSRLQRVLDIYRGYAGPQSESVLRALLRTIPTPRETPATCLAYSLAAALTSDRDRGFFLTEVGFAIQS